MRLGATEPPVLICFRPVDNPHTVSHMADVDEKLCFVGVVVAARSQNSRTAQQLPLNRLIGPIVGIAVASSVLRTHWATAGGRLFAQD